MANNLMNRRNDAFDMFNNMDRWFNNWGSDFPAINMKTDVSESKTAYDVVIDLPDMDKKDISITYDNDILTVSAHRDSLNNASDKDGNLIMNERSYGRFSRQYRLPDVDRQQISAKYEDGSLKINLPKAQDLPNNNTKINID
ncbi:putative molecular chaperone, small heat shock protein, Hsp20 family [Bombilactobacillus mellis]|uniref:Putative molecular chaperone, small heat shock protein, Hsp20 family n=1 Tax=Bombilactobacillus mellis TaxID=1218508 RepID=A0A0F4KWT8_9LACO|nr:Hsp20/alpha crystallin family protein [Bombilactobacillus mellis]MBI0107010.1 Hsp20/alpha crystallin family protein [Lactobacillus sp. W8086]MBI0108474.1 Hsp20/alpha crystallin family protein [Lactobacillus sp. W8085]MBI0111692.1 Hsp20/alpha crystallin family protein [Lactobacillus sp. W8088]MBI0115407.1 Hsp20/alpha crystallin family protein [Lactobacillus sp. W8087]MBI0119132.1 Hsp20/alpha crystallin family protein [Lactobacillus sp. W8089]MBI0131097.1 Hsp20/alpha crystallin family protei